MDVHVLHTAYFTKRVGMTDWSALTLYVEANNVIAAVFRKISSMQNMYIHLKGWVGDSNTQADENTACKNK